jgi:hypothetical protein
MFIDTIAFQQKMTAYKQLFENKAWVPLPSYREMQIQIAKLERVTEAFRKRYPMTLLLTLDKRRVGKMRGSDVHRVNQQIKVVERLAAKLIEEQVVSDLRHHGWKAPKGKVRSASQKYIQALSSQFHKPQQKALDEAGAALGAILMAAADVKTKTKTSDTPSLKG